jgi:cytochrome c oxidase subunit 3
LIPFVSRQIRLCLFPGSSSGPWPKKFEDEETMHNHQASFKLNRFLQRSSNLALAFFGLSLLLLGVSFAAAWMMIESLSFQPAENRILFPVAFVASTVLLGSGSFLLHRASMLVRFEKQTDFRRSLAWALVLGTAFVAAQTYGLWCLIAQNEAARSVGLKDGAFAFVLLHGVHFVVALLFVAFVFLRALADKYDHEYSFGVTVCAWFWHALGIAWLAIMAAFLIAGVSVLPGDGYPS